MPPRWWPPKLSPFWVRVWRPFRKRKQVHEEELMEVDVRGLDHLRSALATNQGVLITPNHSGHADAHIMYHVCDQVGSPFYFLTAWQVFFQQGFLGRLILQHHGCFSIDREGTDLKAFRQATDILENQNHPLVIFPEGEVYHVNERVTPFREGAAAIAVSAARRAKRDVVCVPCGIKYEYLEDPTENLVALMNRLEQEIFWRPRPDLPLPDRIYRFAEGAMALKELEYFGRTSAGALPERTEALATHILGLLEEDYNLAHAEKPIPERVKALRREAVKALSELDANDPARQQHQDRLDDMFLVVQLYSYPGDYVRERPTIERMAETLDKLEEDVLGVYSASIKGPRKATVAFGEPLAVDGDRKNKAAASQLTEQLEVAVQQLLDGIRISPDRFGDN